MSVGAISASDSISVKVVWEGDSHAVPDNVIVNLLKNGHVVDSAKLNASNNWRTTFEVDDDDGDYDVKEVQSSDFSSSVKGSADEGFVIKNTLVRDVLKSDANNSNTNGNSSDRGQKLNDVLKAAGDNETDNATDNSTSNATDNSTGNASANTNGGSKDTSTKTSKDTTQNGNKPKSTVTTTTITKTYINEPDDNNTNTTKSTPIETGLPIIVLFAAVFVAAFIPIFRKR